MAISLLVAAEGLSSLQQVQLQDDVFVVAGVALPGSYEALPLPGLRAGTFDPTSLHVNWTGSALSTPINCCLSPPSPLLKLHHLYSFPILHFSYQMDVLPHPRHSPCSDC